MGLLLLSIYLATGLIVTKASKDAVAEIESHARKRGIAATKRGTLIAQLNHTITGYEIGGISITPEMAVQFMWAQLLVLWGSFSSAFVLHLGKHTTLDEFDDATDDSSTASGRRHG